MPVVLNEPANLGDVLLYENEHFFYSRDEAVIVQGETIVLGQVLAKVETSDEYVAYDPDGDNDEVPGIDVAAGVALRDSHATDDIVKTMVLVRHAIVKTDGLVWPESITPEQQNEALKQLISLGILPRR